MNWLTILELATELLTQALAAFAAGQRKESTAVLSLSTVHHTTLRLLVDHTGPPAQP